MNSNISIIYIYAKTPRGEAWLKFQTDPDDPPYRDETGFWIVRSANDLDDLAHSAELAGLRPHDAVFGLGRRAWMEPLVQELGK